MLPILGGLFASGAFSNAGDKAKMISSYATKAINSLDPAGLGQTNAILGVYGKPTIDRGADMADVSADISATNLAREKQTEDDRLKAKYENVVGESLAKQSTTPEKLADILSKYSFLFKR